MPPKRRRSLPRKRSSPLRWHPSLQPPRKRIRKSRMDKPQSHRSRPRILQSPPQSSASHQAPKKQLPRKSVSTVTKEQTVTKPAATEDSEETAVDRAQDDTARAEDPEHNEQSDGEPGPAEEPEMPSQQAEV